MKRSQVNQVIEEAKTFCNRMNFNLPPFAYWSLADWAEKGDVVQEILDNQMGWDITDFGRGEFARLGVTIFVLRNGNANNPAYDKPYCEKLLIVEEEQMIPYHFHWRKMEDIINRGGGNLMVKLRQADEQEHFTDDPITVTIDGERVEAKPEQALRLVPGQSITLKPYQYHAFWAEKGAGKLLLGEVSTVADEANDNRFYDPVGRMPEIVEDAAPLHLIFNDYARLDDQTAWPTTWSL